MTSMLPVLFPFMAIGDDHIHDGAMIGACSFCKRAPVRAECKQHYAKLASDLEGYYQCPFGFTSRSFYFAGRLYAVTGVIAFPRFDTPQEREMAKKYPAVKVTREAIEGMRECFRGIDTLRADTVQEAAQVFPQAFHELRKLNRAVLQYAEREIRDCGERSGLLNIRSAAELMRNNFDILEALSNIDGMRALPADATINVFDLVYKTKCILEERATAHQMWLVLDGVRAIIRGSQKSFPIVPAVLLENAIKYGRANTEIRAEITTVGTDAVLTVENESDFHIDPGNCFNRGSRYAGNSVEGGGFGLFIAKEIVLAHSGRIRCERDGTVVRMIVELPLVQVIPKNW